MKMLVLDFENSRPRKSFKSPTSFKLKMFWRSFLTWIISILGPTIIISSTLTRIETKLTLTPFVKWENHV